MSWTYASLKLQDALSRGLDSCFGFVLQLQDALLFMMNLWLGLSPQLQDALLCMMDLWLGLSLQLQDSLLCMMNLCTLADLAIKLKPHSHPDPKYSSLYLDVVITLTRVGTFPPPAYFTFVFLVDLSLKKSWTSDNSPNMQKSHGTGSALIC